MLFRVNSKYLTKMFPWPGSSLKPNTNNTGVLNLLLEDVLEITQFLEIFFCLFVINYYYFFFLKGFFLSFLKIQSYEQRNGLTE